MNWKLLVLALAVAGLAGYLFLYDAPRLRETEAAIAKDALFFPTSVDAVDTLAIERDDLPFRIVRRSDGWWIEEPIVERADDLKVEDTLAQLVAAKRWRWLGGDVPDSAWAMYALAEDSPGRRRIVLAGEDGHFALDVGNSLNGRELRYARRVGRDELEIADPVIDTIAEGRHHGYRDTRLFAVSDSAIVDMEFEVDGRSWQARRDERGRWWSGFDGRTVRLRRGELDDIALTVAEAKVRGYLRDGLDPVQLSGYGLDEPWARVTIHTDDGRTGEVHLGNEADDRVYFARRAGEGTVFVIAPGFLRALELDPRTLIDRNPIEDNVRRAQRLQVTLADGRFAAVTRDGLGFVVASENGRVPPGDAIDIAAYNSMRLIEDFQPQRTMVLLGGGDEVFDEVLARIELDWVDNHVECTVGWWGKRTEPWLHVEGQDEIHQISRDLALQLRTLVELAYQPQ